MKVAEEEQKMIVALFEDEAYTNFLPLTYTRPVFECRSGMFSFIERAQTAFPESESAVFTRDYLVPTFNRRVTCPVNEPDSIDDDVLLVNGTLIVDEKVKRLVKTKLSRNVLVRQKGRVALARVSESLAKNYARELCSPVRRVTFEKLAKECKTLESSELDFFTYPWDLVNSCAELIKKDYSRLGRRESEGTIDDKVVAYGDKSEVYVGRESSIEAFVTLDTRGGPIFIGKETTVQSGSRISGPAYIGDNVIVTGGLIREGCSIGHVCRVGGEVEDTIIQGYSNKYHEGFVGHAYIGEWVNLAADTTTSDIKNTYGTVQVVIGGKKVNTGCTKVGCFVGDHAKTAIGTQIFAGRKIGVASHVYGFVTDDVPSFTIWAKTLRAKLVELEFESAIKTHERVLSRRGIKQTREDVRLQQHIFKMTAGERKKAGIVKRKFTI